MTCPKMNANLADLLFEQPVPDEAQKHVTECSSCASELAALRATMEALDEWRVPEPSPFFDAKLYARLRSEQATPPAGWGEQIRDWVLYSSKLNSRRVAAAALAMLLAIGSGTFALLDHERPQPAPTSAALRDLQSYDGNVQLFQQLNALDAGDDSSGGASN